MKHFTVIYSTNEPVYACGVYSQLAHLARANKYLHARWSGLDWTAGLELPYPAEERGGDACMASFCLQVACGQDHSLFLTETGKVYACGWGADGQTGECPPC